MQDNMSNAAYCLLSHERYVSFHSFGLKQPIVFVCRPSSNLAQALRQVTVMYDPYGKRPDGFTLPSCTMSSFVKPVGWLQKIAVQEPRVMIHLCNNADVEIKKEK